MTVKTTTDSIVEGVTGFLDELCKHFGKTRSNVDTRMCKGMTLEEALLSLQNGSRKLQLMVCQVALNIGMSLSVWIIKPANTRKTG